MNIPKEIQAHISSCKKHWDAGLKELELACKEYVLAIDKYSNARQCFKQEMHWLTPREWDMMERVGRGSLTVMAFIMPNEYQLRALNAFDLPTQQALCGTPAKAPVPQTVLTRGVQVAKAFDEMSEVEVNTLIDYKAGRIRTIEEQRQAAAANAQRAAQAVCYTISQGRLIVNCRASFSIDEVAEILREMRKEFK